MIDVNQKKLEQSLSSLPQGAERVASAVSSFHERAKTILKERPGTILLVALALGFAAGRFLSRR